MSAVVAGAAPLRANLTFSPDNTYTIGRPGGVSRPSALYVAGLAEIGGVIYFGASANTIALVSDGVWRFQNSGGTGINRIQWGGTTSSFPSWKASGAGFEARLADDSASTFLITSYTRTVATTVASLPAAATAGAGARSFVTDANSTTFNATAVGGGANAMPVVCDGTIWKIG